MLSKENTLRNNLAAYPNGVSLPYEFDALSKTRRYSSWVIHALRPYLGQRILEVGAGIGNFSEFLPVNERLIITEPDPVFFEKLKKRFQGNEINNKIIRVELFNALDDSSEIFSGEDPDTIVSFNVLEHIQNDRGALNNLSNLLRNSRATGPKRLITFAPAHSWAYGAMDKKFGHFRRYNKKYFKSFAREVTPEAKIKFEFFNIFPLLPWIINGRILKNTRINPTSLRIFDTLCPLFQPVDALIHRYLKIPLGQSIIFVLQWD